MALTKRQQQGAESREQILDVAEALMAERGVSATSISALTKASGLPASSIYWHFGSKDGVVVAVMERGARRFFASLAPPSSFTGSDGERIQAQLRDTARAFDEHGDFLRLLLALLVLRREGGGDAAAVITTVRSEARARIAAMLDAIDEPTDDGIADLMLAMIDGAFIAHLEDPRVDFRTRFDQLGRVVEMLLDSRR